MISLYRAGDSVVHRARAAIKLLLLAVAALALSLLPLEGAGMGAALVIVGVAYGVARMPARVLAAEAWRLRWIVVILGGALWIFSGPVTAWENTARVVTIMLLASLLTLTTRMEDVTGVIRRGVGRIGRGRVDADAVAFALSLTVTMVPVVAGFANEVRDASRARGARLGLRWIVPLLVRTLRHADDVGDALAARGLVEGGRRAAHDAGQSVA